MKLYANTRGLENNELAFRLSDTIDSKRETFTVYVDTYTTSIHNIIKQAVEQLKTLTGKVAHFEH
jgi:hypothetical protein